MSDLIKQCDECKLNECINCEHSWADIQELKQQLAEKDKEIKKHIDALEYWENNIPNQRHLIRKQVCDEIMEKIGEEIKRYPIICEDDNGDMFTCINVDVVKKLLDQIEQGKKD